MGSSASKTNKQQRRKRRKHRRKRRRENRDIEFMEDIDEEDLNLDLEHRQAAFEDESSNGHEQRQHADEATDTERTIDDFHEGDDEQTNQKKKRNPSKPKRTIIAKTKHLSYDHAKTKGKQYFKTNQLGLEENNGNYETGVINATHGLPEDYHNDQDYYRAVAMARAAEENRLLHKMLMKESEKGPTPPRMFCEFIGRFSIKLETDTRDCSISGSAFLSNGDIVLADFKNQNLKLLNENLEIKSSLKLEVAPKGICARKKESEVYVTYKSIMFDGIKVVQVDTNGNMTLIRTIRTDGTCYGIASNNGGLAVIANIDKTWQIQLMDLHGKTKKLIKPKSDGIPIFTKPENLTVTKELDLLVVDRGSNSLFGINPNGRVQYQCTGLRDATGICVDDKHSILISSAAAIQQVSTTGEKIAVLIRRDDVGFVSTCISYDCDDGLLVVAGISNSVTAFRLSASKL